MAEGQGLNAGDVYVSAGARIDERGFKQWDALYQKASAKRDIEKEVKLDVHGEGDLKKLNEEIDRTDKETKKLEKSAAGGGRGIDNMARTARGASGDFGKLNLNILGVTGRMTSLLRVALLLSPAIAAVGSEVVALVGSLGQATLGAGALGVSLGAVGATSLPLVVAGAVKFKGVLDVVKKSQDAHNAALIENDKRLKDMPAAQAQAIIALRQMSKEERELVGVLQRGKKAFEESTGPGVDQMFNGVSAGLRHVIPELGRYRDEWKDLGDSIGDSFESAGKALAGREWRTRLDALSSASDEVATSIADSIGSIGEIAANVAVAALPDLVDGLDGAADGLDRIAEASDSAEFKRQVQDWIEDTKLWLRLLRDTGDLLVTVLGGGVSEGRNLVRELDKIVRRWDRFLESDEGQTKMRRFFRDMARLAEDIYDFIVGFADGVVDMGKKLAPVAVTMGTLAGHILGIDRHKDGIKTVGRVLGGLAVLKLTGVTALIRGLVSLGTNAGNIRSVLAKLPGLDRLFGGKVKDALVERGNSPAKPLYVWDVNDGPGGGGRGGGKGTPTPAPIPGGKPPGGVLGKVGSAARGIGAGVAIGTIAITADKNAGNFIDNFFGGGLKKLQSLKVPDWMKPNQGAFGNSDAIKDLSGAVGRLLSGNKVDKLTGQLRALGRGSSLQSGAAGGKNLNRLADGLRNAVKAGDPGKLKSVSREISRVGESVGGLKGAKLREIARDANKLAETKAWRDLRSELRRTDDRFDDMRKNTKGSMRDIRRTTEENTERIKKRLSADTAAGKRALSNNFKEAVKEVRKSMRAGTVSTRDGTREIHRLMVEALKVYGLNARQATNILKTGDPDANKGREGGATRATSGAAGGNEGRAGGGLIGRWGERGRDRVRAVLGRGEAVLNHPQQRIVNAALRSRGLDLGRVFQMTKGSKHHMAEGGYAGDEQAFAGGGIAGMIAAANRLDAAQFPYDLGGGHEASPAPFGPMDCSGAVSYVLQHGGVNIPTMTSGQMQKIGKPGEGAVTLWATPGHVLMRINGRFFGTGLGNPGGGAGWGESPGAGYLAGRTVRHFGSGDVGRFDAMGMEEIKAPKVRGEGAIPALVQRNLDVQTAGANDYIGRVAEVMGIGAGDPGEFPGGGDARANMELGRRMAGSMGWAGQQWAALRELWTRESGWSTTADNPTSDAYGIPQALPGSKMASEGSNWRTNAGTQIKWGLKYIRDRYGSPSAALSFHDSHNWYGGGGLVEAFQGGGFAGGGPVTVDQAAPMRGGPAPGGSLRGEPGGPPSDQGYWEGGLSIKSLRNKNSDRIESYERILARVETLGKDYGLAERRYGRISGDLELIDPDTGKANDKNIDKVSEPLRDLIRIRRRILRQLRAARDRAKMIINTYQRIIRQLRRSLKHSKKKKRPGIRKRIKSYEGRIDQWQATLKDLGYDIGAAQEDVLDVTGEYAEIQKARKGEPQPPADTSSDLGGGDFGGGDLGGGDTGAADTSADQQAIIDQQAANLARLTADVQAGQASLTALQSPGDLGTGLGSTALASARRDVVMPMGFGTGMMGAPGAGMPGQTGGILDAGGAVVPTIVINSSALIQGGPSEQRAIAGAVVGALGAQSAVPARGVSVG